MPLFSDHLSNMYYSGSSLYTSSPYSYSSASPYGSSYSSSYLNPGGNYSTHSSLGGYSRAPLSSRWLTSGGRAYSPMLSTISEKGTSSPVRINSPRRIPISGRSYVSSAYTSRPIHINTADIDVSRDKYRTKLKNSNSTLPTGLPPRRESPLINKESGHDKPDTGIDTSPGPRQSTIKRDRAVVRLHTVKRKERDSPRKPLEAPNKSINNDLPNTEVSDNQTESKKWRQKLADDLEFKTQKEKKTLGAMLVEKFTLKEKIGDEDNCTKMSPKTHNKDKSPLELNDDDLKTFTNKSVDRRCSMELLAEQASLLDSLIRRENLSTVPVDLSQVGVDDNFNTGINLQPDDTKIKNKIRQDNRLTTTKSDHSLHDRLKSKDNKDLVLPKRRSLRKCSSGGNIRKLDCIKESPKKAKDLILLPVEDQIHKSIKIKPKIRTKITSTVEVIPTTPQLKFFVENVTVEETSRPFKKDIIFSSTVDEKPLNEITTDEGQRNGKPLADIQLDSSMKKLDQLIEKDKNLSNANVQITKGHRKSIKSKIKDKSKPQIETGNLTSPEPEDGNFWEKIGKRETVYLIKRKQNLDEAKEQSKRSLFWFPEEETVNVDKENNEIAESPLLEEVNNANIIEPVKETNKNIEIIVPKDENIVETIKESNKKSEILIQKEEKSDANIDIHCKKIVNPSSIKDINCSGADENTVSSNLETNENIVGCEIVVNSPDLPMSENSNSTLKECYNSELEMNSKKENSCEATLKEMNNQKMEFTKNIVKSKVILNKNTEENIKSNSCNKFNAGKQKKSSSKENSIKTQSISVPQANSINDSTQNSTMNNENNLNILSNTSQLNLAEDQIVTMDLEKTLAEEIGQETSPKDEFEKVTPITIENNAQSFVDNAKVNDSKNDNNNQNIPDTQTIDSFVDKSSKKVDKVNQITEICEIKAKQSNVVSSSPTSLKEASAVIKGTCIKNKKGAEIEPAKIEANIEISNLIADHDKTQPEKTCEKNENEITSNSRKTDYKTTEPETKSEIKDKPVPPTNAIKVFTNTKPVKEEKALKPLIATPRPLQKRKPQTIRSSSSSSSESSDDDSSEDTEEDGGEVEGESGSSHGSAECIECENNPDGRTSTGSADSGFDSSAPTSPSGFLDAKKGGDSPSTSAGATPPQTFTHDVLEQELEQSTAYDLFRKTGRFTPPARTIPRFRKYTIEDFQFIKVLGKGSFGKVMLAELRGTEYYYAVKCLKKDVVLEDDDVECTLIERKVLALGTNHPYLCHLFATFQTDSHLFFVMEYLNGGDLMFHIQQSGRFPEVRARFYAAEIVSGLKFLHKRGIVYRDLKLDNILLDFDGHVRIADFGMCKLQIYLDKTADTFCGTPDYMAPEIIKGLKYNQTVDWWSFGVLLYEMLIGQSPFSGCDEDELFWSICNEMPSYPRFLSPESLSILTRLLDKDARTRLGGPECMHGEIRDQKFFEEIHWDRLERRELEAPFKPRVRHPMDTQYFDRAFTGERPRLTAVEPQVLRSMDQEPFRGFSYTNPNATDR